MFCLGGGGALTVSILGSVSIILGAVQESFRLG